MHDEHSKTGDPAVGSTRLVGPVPAPLWREFRYLTMVVGDDAECVALITQVMNSYPAANRAAVTAWFSNAYGQPNDKAHTPAP